MRERDDDLQRQIRQLADRLDRIESLLNITPPGEESEPAEEQEAPPDVETPSAPNRPAKDETPPELEPEVEPQHEAPSPTGPEAPPVQPQHTASAELSASSPQSPRTVSPAQSEPQRSTLELTIAAKWFAWIGAIVIVLGAAFALREFGADLWARLSPAAKCFIVASFGAALIAGGEYTLRRIGKLASVGLFSAGLGVLYLDAYATFQFFDPPLVPERASFLLMAVVALLGIGLTWRTRFRTIGVLAILAGYLVPLLLTGTSSSPIELLGYLTMLLGIGLVLSALAPRPFRALRYVALGGHIVIAGLWMAAHGRANWMLALIFMSGWWVMVLAEATFAAVRRQSALGNPVAVFTATACYVTAGCLILNGALPAGPDWLGIYTAAIAVLSIVTAFQFGIGIDALRRPAKLPIDQLSVTLLAQAGLLLIVAVALQFDGFGRSVGWLALAVTAIELGNRLRSRGLDVFGIIVGLLALFMVAMIDRVYSTALDTQIWSLDTGQWVVNLDRWSLLALGAILITHYAAQRFRSGPDIGWQPVPIVAAIVGTTYWLGLCLARSETLATTTGFVIGAAILMAVDPINRKPRLIEQAVIVLLLAGLHWLIIDAGSRLHANWSPSEAMVLANGQVAVGLVIAVGLVLCSMIVQHRANIRVRPILPGPSEWTFAALLPVLASLFLLTILSFEIDRAVALLDSRNVDMHWSPTVVRLFGITALAAVGSAVIATIGRARSMRPMLDTSVTLAVVCAFTWLSFGTVGAYARDGVVDALVIVNMQFGVGVVCVAALAVSMLVLLRGRDTSAAETRTCILIAALLGAIGLWIGSIEIIRALHGDRMAMHMGLSVYWGLYAVAMVVLGFARRWPAVRYAGLALLGLVVIKALTVDLATVDRIWRIVSLLVTGLLAVGVSIAYGKLAPRLLAAQDQRAEEKPQA